MFLTGFRIVVESRLCDIDSSLFSLEGGKTISKFTLKTFSTTVFGLVWSCLFKICSLLELEVLLDCGN